MEKSKKVAIFVETSSDYGRRIVSGIAEYLRTNQHWSVFLEQNDKKFQPHDWIRLNNWDGVICRQTDHDLETILIANKVPVVNLNDKYQIPTLPWIGSDHLAIGALGAKYLRHIGTRNYAFCGFTNERWSRLRKEGFGMTVEEFDKQFLVWESVWSGRTIDYWSKDIVRLRHWIASLPKPIGIMAANDVRALHLLEACRQLELVIPEEVAIIGVDDEETLCNLSLPRLTSIRPDCEKIGYQAAVLLDQMMSNSKLTVQSASIQPKGVIARPSTDILAISDSLVIKTIKKLRNENRKYCDINNIAKELKISRKMLDKRFENALHRTPADVFKWVLISRIQKLLLDTDMPLSQIAKIEGLVSSQNMNVIFKNIVGVSAGTYRLTHRNKSLTCDSAKAVETIHNAPPEIESSDNRPITWADADFVA